MKKKYTKRQVLNLLRKQRLLCFDAWQNDDGRFIFTGDRIIYAKIPKL